VTPSAHLDGPDEQALRRALRHAVTEVELFADDGGWDGPRQLVALVPTAELLAHEPGLVGQIGPDVQAEPAATAPGDGMPAYTPVEQGEIPGDSLADALAKIAWPDEIDGCVLVVEIMVRDGDQLAEGRLAVGVMRGVTGGDCALRWRHAPDGPVTFSPDLAPDLVAALRATFEP
jgi:hypothetical protein